MRKSALCVSKLFRSILSNSLVSTSSGVTFRVIIFSTSEMFFSNFWICCSLDLLRLEANPIVLSLMHPFNAYHRIPGSFTDGLFITIKLSKCSFISFRKILFCSSVQIKLQRAACSAVERMVILPVTALWSERDRERVIQDLKCYDIAI